MYFYCVRNFRRQAKLYRMKRVWQTCFLLHSLDHQEKLKPFWWPRVTFYRTLRQCGILCHWLQYCPKSVAKSACVCSKWKPAERLCLLSWAAYLLSVVDTSRLSRLLLKLCFSISDWFGLTSVSPVSSHLQIPVFCLCSCRCTMYCSVHGLVSLCFSVSNLFAWCSVGMNSSL